MFRVLISTAVMLAAGIGVVGAQVPHIVGSWELDVDASTYPGPPPRSQVRTYFPLDDGYLLGIAVTVDAQGNASFLQFAARSDGEDYPEYNPFTLAGLQIADERTSATYSETPVDEYTVSWIDKNNGVAYATGTRRVSEDGNTLTIEFEMTDPDGQLRRFELVFSRQ